ncbi:MAG: hypothetical protein WDA16_08270, partial [Candidatus Thermoplasmatota archaeon]
MPKGAHSGVITALKYVSLLESSGLRHAVTPELWKTSYVPELCVLSTVYTVLGVEPSVTIWEEVAPIATPASARIIVKHVSFLATTSSHPPLIEIWRRPDIGSSITVESIQARVGAYLGDGL